ncbi:MAG: DUF5597 domain-containing protein [Lachnospiraceae bacterium]|nr:DUF5597 domain-containing protein [Lachnospiraceae bacterium]
METFPEIRNENGVFTFRLGGQPCLLLGGELHNSSASDPVYMEKRVLPALRRLRGNLILAPVYWEKLEPEEGVYDFTLVDVLVRMMRREGFKLGLLWFGTWKGPDSLFLPGWLKAELTDGDFQRDENGRLIRQISPFAERVLTADRKAYVQLMRHLREIDEEAQTVVLMQVENEPGTWFHRRDHSARAEAAFASPLPADAAAFYGVSGSWEALQEDADEAFMSYYVAKAVGGIAAAGKEVCPLPVFTNCVPNMGFLHVAGGPSAENAEAWKTFAPAVDVLTPNVYDPGFERIVSAYNRPDNPLMIPETGLDKDLLSKLLFTVGTGGLMYSPFGIEELFPEPRDEYHFRLPGRRPPIENGEALAEAYQILQLLYPEILGALKEKRIHTLIQGPDEKAGTPVPGFGGMLRFEGGSSRMETLQRYVFRFDLGVDPVPETAPLAAAMVIEEGEDCFLFAGVNIAVSLSAADPDQTVFVEDYREYVLRDGALTEGRTLNGDERNTITAGEQLTVLRFRLSTHR